MIAVFRSCANVLSRLAFAGADSSSLIENGTSFCATFGGPAIGF